MDELRDMDPFQTGSSDPLYGCMLGTMQSTLPIAVFSGA